MNANIIQEQATFSAPLLTTVQAAELINVHPQTIRRLIETGRISALRLGNHFRIDKQSFLNELKVMHNA